MHVQRWRLGQWLSLSIVRETTRGRWPLLHSHFHCKVAGARCFWFFFTVAWHPKPVVFTSNVQRTWSWGEMIAMLLSRQPSAFLKIVQIAALSSVFLFFCVLFVKSDSHPPFWHPFSHSVVIHTHLSDIPFHTVWWLTPIFLTSFFTQCKCLSLQFSFSVRGEKRKWLFWI